jgi:glycosyltransferase involved in cell wall biosynthesis
MKFLSKDKRIKYKRLPKRVGRSKARNIGNSMATSKIICVNDADDISFRQRARETINAFKKGCDVFYSSFCVMDAFGRITDHIKVTPFDIERVKKPPYYTYICHSSMAYKRGAKYSSGDWSNLGIDDWKLQIDLYKKGYKFAFSKKILVGYRMSSENIELTRNNKKVLKLKRGIIEKL